MSPEGSEPLMSSGSSRGQKSQATRGSKDSRVMPLGLWWPRQSPSPQSCQSPSLLSLKSPFASLFSLSSFYLFFRLW